MALINIYYGLRRNLLKKGGSHMRNNGLLEKVFGGGLALSIITSMLILGGVEAAPKPTPTEKPQYGGVLKIIYRGGPVNMGYPGLAGSIADLTCNFPAVESLVLVDERGLPVPWLATGWKISPDSKSITFTLRKGVKFHDGTDFNAGAVKYTFDMYMTSPLPELKGVTSIDVVDDYTVRFNLSQFQAQLLNTLATTRAAWVLSPTAVKTQTKEWCMTHPVGTGPFKFKDFKRDVSLKFEKFDGYWQKGKPYLDGIEYVFIADQTTGLMAFKAGQAHVNLSINARDASELQGMGKYNITQAPASVMACAGDSANPKSPFGDIRVRRAVEHAIDREAISKGLGYGFYRAVNQPFPPASWAYNPAVVGCPYNPQKSKELLAQAGYPNGFKTRIIYETTYYQEMQVALQSYLSQVGIDAKLESVTSALYVQYLTGGWDNGLLSSNNIPWNIGMDPGQSLLQRLSSKGSYNVSVIHPDDYEAKLSKANAEPDFEKRKALLQELMRLSVDEYAMIIPLFQDHIVGAKYPEVRDSKIREVWTIQWTPADAWLSR
jgi:peptide/nickel transport system substrate-binding protein